ncbi:MAG TPA: nucleoside hydrolase [Candidatus Aphodomonas merdavium]|nr:nucleoside hydrolase [Candidatus Aphodomonas merdavium]
MKKQIPIIMDCDPGHDDAIALVLAAASPQLDIRCVTTTAGNQTLEKTTYNALRILTLLGRTEIPVAKGRKVPMLAEPMQAPSVHGVSGLDGPPLPEPGQKLSPLSSVEMMAQTIRACPEPLTIVATGPLTNVAGLLLAHPELKERIARISLMGGGLCHGNWTPAAEFNILVDPEAADIVYQSGIPITMAGLDVTEKAVLYEEDFARIRAVGNRVAVTVADWLDFFYAYHKKLGYAGATVHDPVAVTALIRPEILTARPVHVDIETDGDYCRGATVADWFGVTGKALNVTALTDIDREAFAALIVEAVSFYQEEGKA